MSDQNGTVWRGTGGKRHRASSPAVCSTHESGADKKDTETIGAQPDRLPRNKRSRPLCARALGGRVPAAPIFIPAGQICQELSERESKPEKENRPGGSTDTGLLTAELLNRRWLQGKAS
jgi:hypothetical protein